MSDTVTTELVTPAIAALAERAMTFVEQKPGTTTATPIPLTHSPAGRT